MWFDPWFCSCRFHGWWLVRAIGPLVCFIVVICRHVLCQDIFPLWLVCVQFGAFFSLVFSVLVSTFVTCYSLVFMLVTWVRLASAVFLYLSILSYTFDCYFSCCSSLDFSSILLIYLFLVRSSTYWSPSI